MYVSVGGRVYSLLFIFLIRTVDVCDIGKGSP